MAKNFALRITGLQGYNSPAINQLMNHTNILIEYYSTSSWWCTSSDYIIKSRHTFSNASGNSAYFKIKMVITVAVVVEWLACLPVRQKMGFDQSTSRNG